MKLGSSAVITGFYILTKLATIFAYIKFTNLKCVNYDKSFLDFRECKLKALSRNTVAAFMHAQIFQLLLNNITVNLDVYKKANGYRPFMYNITVDFCSFLKNKKRLPFAKLLMDTIEIYSNINHTCPFNHDFIIKDMVLKTKQLQLLPVPMGDYLLRASFAVYNDYKATVGVYIQVVEN